MCDYSELENLKDLYLEDSWVLDIVARPGVLDLEVDLVLRESHPLYQTPKSGEQYCYRRGGLVFTDVTQLIWTKQGASPAKDASGEIDYGSINSMRRDNCTYKLEGDFGAIEVVAASLSVDWTPTVSGDCRSVE